MKWQQVQMILHIIFLWGSILLAILSLPVLGLCEQWKHGSECGETFMVQVRPYWNFLNGLILIFLIFQFCYYFLELLVLIVKRMSRNRWIGKEKWIFPSIFLGVIGWFF